MRAPAARLRAATVVALAAAYAGCVTTAEPGSSTAVRSPAATAVRADERPEPTRQSSLEDTPVRASAFDPGVELPAGAGRDILIDSCLNCHELTALALFRGFYSSEDWRSLIVTMQANGADVYGSDVDVLADYLAQHYGTGASR